MWGCTVSKFPTSTYVTCVHLNTRHNPQIQDREGGGVILFNFALSLIGGSLCPHYTLCHQQRLKTTSGVSSYSVPQRLVTKGRDVWKVNRDVGGQRKERQDEKKIGK